MSTNKREKIAPKFNYTQSLIFIVQAMKPRRVISVAKKRNALRRKKDTMVLAMKRAIKKHDLELVKKYIFDGADLHEKDGDFVHRTNWDNIPVETRVSHKIVHTAAWSGTKEILDLIVKSGAGINTRTKYSGFTPLDMATMGRNMETLKHLLNIGADPNIEDESGHKPVCAARLMGGEISKKMRKILEPMTSPCTKCEAKEVDICGI